jgi:hypothetical protein
MKIRVENASVTCIRESDDPKFYGIRQAKGESNLFHWLKQQIDSGHPDLPSNFPVGWIKKRMWKDGHMKDEMQQYLRTEKPVHKDEYGTKFYLCLYNGMWAIQGADYYWNEGSVKLTMALVTVCCRELNTHDPEAIAEHGK